jgi:Kef-type K+ transport system membrane component KefB
MTPTNPIVLRGNPLKWIVRCVLFSIFLAVLMTISVTFLLVGFLHLSWGLAFTVGVAVGSAVGAAFAIFVIAIGLIIDQPRMEIGPEGFVLHSPAASRSRRWTDVEGNFIVRGTPLGKVVAYALTEAFKKSQEAASPSKKPGRFESILDDYKLSAGELAELLNEHKRRDEQKGTPNQADPQTGHANDG